MTGRVVFLGLLLFCVAADAEEGKPGLMRKPYCPDLETLACPMNFVPLCGSDGNTYANECTLCAKTRRVKMDIFIVKDGAC